MSQHYEWTLSLRLRRDVPEEFVESLRSDWGIGLQPIGDDGGEALPGGPVARLVRQQLSESTWLWGFYLRVMILDDVFYDMIQTEPPRLARWSATQGWIGFAREELSLHPWLNFYVQDGHAYAAAPGDELHPLSEGAPPFSLIQTTESWR